MLIRYQLQSERRFRSLSVVQSIFLPLSNQCDLLQSLVLLSRSISYSRLLLLSPLRVLYAHSFLSRRPYSTWITMSQTSSPLAYYSPLFFTNFSLPLSLKLSNSVFLLPRYLKPKCRAGISIHFCFSHHSIHKDQSSDGVHLLAQVLKAMEIPSESTPDEAPVSLFLFLFL